ncbi:MAG: rhodanese-like domain-containing protein [Pseudomonadota bacterium]
MEQVVEFTNNHLWLTAALVGSLFLVIFTEFRLQAGAGINLTTADAVQLINNDGQVIDIRPAEAFAAGHIAGARNLTADQVGSNEDRLEALKGSKLIVACQNGLQCGRVVADLRRKGYGDVFALKGGIAQWQQDGLPLVSGKKKQGGKKDKKRKGGKNKTDKNKASAD